MRPYDRRVVRLMQWVTVKLGNLGVAVLVLALGDSWPWIVFLLISSDRHTAASLWPWTLVGALFVVLILFRRLIRLAADPDRWRREYVGRVGLRTWLSYGFSIVSGIAAAFSAAYYTLSAHEHQSFNQHVGCIDAVCGLDIDNARCFGDPPVGCQNLITPLTCEFVGACRRSSCEF
jgi:hypothetical protein